MQSICFNRLLHLDFSDFTTISIIFYSTAIVECALSSINGNSFNYSSLLLDILALKCIHRRKITQIYLLYKTGKIKLCCFSSTISLLKITPTLASVAGWIEYQPVNQSVASSIPSQGTCLVCGPGPQ